MVQQGYSGPVRLNAAVFTRLRTDAGMSVAEIARRANVNRRTLFRYLGGEREQVQPEIVVRLLRVLPFPVMFEPIEVDGELHDNRRGVAV
jgi:transcriptional regulator with XRE-family HTH domain